MSFLGVDIHVKKEEFILQEGISAEAVRSAVQRDSVFDQAALAEERMYLTWFNVKLKSLGLSEVRS